MNLHFKSRWKIGVVALAAFASGTLSLSGVASAARISNPVAVFAGLDKITGRITSFDVYMNETVQFGALQVTPKVCYSRDDTETQKIDGFVEVDEITLDRKIRRIFTGWMFADSPGLNAVEHPIYDVWLTGCKVKSNVPRPADLKLPDPTPQPDPALKQEPAAKNAAPVEPAPANPNQAGQNQIDQNTMPAGQDPGTLETVPPADGSQLPPLQDPASPEPEAPPLKMPKINGVVPNRPGLY
jgi:hypothetical protein